MITFNDYFEIILKLMIKMSINKHSAIISPSNLNNAKNKCVKRLNF